MIPATFAPADQVQEGSVSPSSLTKGSSLTRNSRLAYFRQRQPRVHERSHHAKALGAGALVDEIARIGGQAGIEADRFLAGKGATHGLQQPVHQHGSRRSVAIHPVDLGKTGI